MQFLCVVELLQGFLFFLSHLSITSTLFHFSPWHLYTPFLTYALSHSPSSLVGGESRPVSFSDQFQAPFFTSRTLQQSFFNTNPFSFSFVYCQTCTVMANQQSALPNPRPTPVHIPLFFLPPFSLSSSSTAGCLTRSSSFCPTVHCQGVGMAQG